MKDQVEAGDMLRIRDIPVEDTFAEAFTMVVARVVVTARSRYWVDVASQVCTGYGTSVLGCDAEAGIEGRIGSEHTPDGRPGASLLYFAFRRESLEQAVANRVGQCVLTCPTTACYNGLAVEEGRELRVGSKLRFFGDGHQSSKMLDGRRFWRIPVMEGEFLCEDHFGTVRGVAGGNFLILARDVESGLSAAEHAVSAMRSLGGIILPFPGGIVRGGSKVGSRYRGLRASTNEAYCPTLRNRVSTALTAEENCVYEIVIDGLCLADVRKAMRVGIEAACRPGVTRISAGHYDGKLGTTLIRLHDLFASE